MNDAIDDLFAEIKSGRNVEDSAKEIAEFYGVPCDKLLEAYHIICAANARAPVAAPISLTEPRRQRRVTTDQDFDRAMIGFIKAMIRFERMR